MARGEDKEDLSTGGDAQASPDLIRAEAATHFKMLKAELIRQGYDGERLLVTLDSIPLTAAHCLGVDRYFWSDLHTTLSARPPRITGEPSDLAHAHLLDGVTTMDRFEQRYRELVMPRTAGSARVR